MERRSMVSNRSAVWEENACIAGSDRFLSKLKLKNSSISIQRGDNWSIHVGKDEGDESIVSKLSTNSSMLLLREKPLCPPSICRPSVSQKRSLKRRVRFNIAEGPELIPTNGSLERNEPSSEAVSNPWLSRAEISRTKQEADSIVKYYLKSRPRYIESTRRFLSKCAQSDSSCVCLRTDDAVRFLMDESIRGLEDKAVSMLWCRKRRSIQALLESQRRLDATETATETDIPSSRRAHLLALQYRRTTQYAAVWARVMGDGDAMCVAGKKDEDIGHV